MYNVIPTHSPVEGRICKTILMVYIFLCSHNAVWLLHILVSSYYSFEKVCHDQKYFDAYHLNGS